MPPRVTVAAIALAVVAPLAGCSGGGDRACDAVLHERLHPSSALHLLPGADEPDYLSDPPTSGPHLAAPAPEGVLDAPLDRPSQVGALEQGVVLLQHRDLEPGALARLEGLAGAKVVVAPNPGLPDRVVATAWTAKQRCRDVDLDAVRQFVENAPPVPSG